MNKILELEARIKRSAVLLSQKKYRLKLATKTQKMAEKSSTQLSYDLELIQYRLAGKYLLVVLKDNWKINGYKSMTVVEELNFRLGKHSHRLIFNVSRHWELNKIFNYHEIIDVWQQEKQWITQYFTGEVTATLLEKIDTRIQDQAFFTSKNWQDYTLQLIINAIHMAEKKQDKATLNAGNLLPNRALSVPFEGKHSRLEDKRFKLALNGKTNENFTPETMGKALLMPSRLIEEPQEMHIALHGDIDYESDKSVTLLEANWLLNLSCPPFYNKNIQLTLNALQPE